MDAGVTPTFITPNQDPFAGKTLANEFRLTRLLGRGGMGSVYLADQISLQRRVAVKLLPPMATADPEMLERFRREAVSAAKLQHPNIVQVFFFGQQDAQYFIAMEFVEGEPLSAILARKKKLPLGEALGIAREIAKALAAAHEQGVVHRDVKPENVFVGKEGRIKLGDFGLARDTAKGGLSTTGQVMGTPYYMPPEQCRGATVDARADLYALGATLYHLANGRPPYVGDSAIDIIHQQVASPVPPADSFGPGTPPVVVDLVRKMMAKDAAERPASAKEVVAAIDRILASARPAAKGPGKPPSSPAVPAVKAAAKPPSRPAVPAVSAAPPRDAMEKKATMIAAVGIVLALVVIFLVWKSVHRTAEPNPQPPPAPAPPAPTNPAPVTPTPPQPVPLPGEPQGITLAREALEHGKYGEAVHFIDLMPEFASRGPWGERIAKMRADALAKLMEMIEPRVKQCKELIAKGQFEGAERQLDNLDRTQVPEVEAKVKELRAELGKAKAGGK